MPLPSSATIHAAQYTLTGIELMRVIKKGQIVGSEGEALSAAEQFYALAV